jgi:hypothetical protein
MARVRQPRILQSPILRKAYPEGCHVNRLDHLECLRDGFGHASILVRSKHSAQQLLGVLFLVRLLLIRNSSACLRQTTTLREALEGPDSILDCLVHNAHRIEMRGESMRKKRNPPQDEKKE